MSMELRGAPEKSGSGRYSSPLRAQRAADTRDRIAKAARELFATHGFGGTTIARIAQRAGVSVQTVYATYGSKGAIVSALTTQFEADADAAGWRARIEHSTEPAMMLRTFAQWTRALLSSSRETITAVQAAATDPAIAQLRDVGDQHRRAALKKLVERIEVAKGLRADVSAERAVDRAWMLTGIELYLAAVDGCGWSDLDYEEWLSEALQQQLLTANALSNRT
ncbi:MAG: TetR/AcrR family transcriptional regulator [Nakamurella sp.]